MGFDVLLLSRLQFAMTIMFHYLFPPLTIGLGAVLVGVMTLWWATDDSRYEAMARFFTKLFAVNFAVGVATGIVMEFEFGTNWAVYSRYVGDVFGSALAAEGIFAFFLESGFLGILVFGWDRVSRPVHWFAALMVFFGSVFSSIWITVANSWMQTPAGYHIVEGPLGPRAEIVDFWAMVFNPSSVERLFHVWAGSGILGGAFVASIAAWYLLHNRHEWFAKRAFLIGQVLILVSVMGSFVSGHSAGETVSEYQPAKLAAYEGHFESGPAPLWLFGIPDTESGEVHYGIQVPGGLSFLVHGDFETPIEGLDATPREDWPNVGLVFQTYHAMLAIGVFFLASSTVTLILIWRNLVTRFRPFLWMHVGAVLLAYAGNQLGWVSAEAGRQPWIVTGQLRTSDALSEAVTAEMVLSSIVMFGIVYALLFAVWWFVLSQKILHGPDDDLAEGGDPEERPALLDVAAGGRRAS
ncbi:MAG: cytochrome ubiquinol oxidase subunit I [Myxococcota bacterium]